MHLGRQLSAPKCTWPCQAVTATICFLAACQLVGRSRPLTEGMCVSDVVTHTCGEVSVWLSFGSAPLSTQLPFVVAMSGISPF